MTRNATKRIIILLILLAVFSVIAFVIPFPKNTVFWIAYACGILAILFQLYIFRSSFGKTDARSRFYGFPIARLGIYYLIIQLVVSVIEIALSKFLPAWVVILINVLILAVALIGCITTETMRDEIAKQDAQLKARVSGLREMQSLSSAMAGQCADETLKLKLQKLAEDFRFSDPVSSGKTAEIETNLLEGLKDLQQALTDGDTKGAETLCGRLSATLAERNRICAVNK